MIIMKIEKYERTGVGKYRLYLDNGEVIDTYDDVILENDLLLKRELNSKIYQKVLIETSLQEQYQACLKYISFRIRSTKEIKDYLKKRNVSEEDITYIVEKLTKEKLLNDDRFCECFIKDKLKFTTMGEYRIVNELKKHLISSSIIEAHYDLMNEDVMQERIENIVGKQIQNNRKLDNSKLRNKLYHHLISLGYSSDLVVKVLNYHF